MISYYKSTLTGTVYKDDPSCENMLFHNPESKCWITYYSRKYDVEFSSDLYVPITEEEAFLELL